MKQSCENLREDLAAVAAGEISADESRRVTAHVGECEACAANLAETRTLFELLDASLPSVEASPTFQSRLVNRIAREIESAEASGAVSGWAPFRRWLVPAALGLLAVAFWLPGGVVEGPQPDSVVAESAPPATSPSQPVELTSSERVGAASTAPSGASREASRDADVPSLERDAELFVDYAVIEDLEMLESFARAAKAG